ncbi:MAG: hypothetical protein IJT15_03315 [Rickettsiales bacterium]|nr:hypothetical protein [Rickettsiales bacterium]
MKNSIFKTMISKGIDTFARINRDIVAGIWQTALIMPLDCAMFIYFTGEPSYPNLDYRFWIFFSIYTIFFIGGYAVAPIIRKRKLISMLTNFVNEGKITQMQKQKIWNIVKDNAKYSPLWSKDGFLSFIMENIYCISIIFAFFGGEGLINACLNGTEKAMSIIHLCLAVSCLLLESRLDKYLAKKVRKKYQMNNMKIFYGVNKDITTRLIADITGDSTSNNLMNLHLESMLEDITDILDVSNDKQIAKKKIQRKFGKTGTPKGRLEKAKQGVIKVKTKTKKVKMQKKKNSIRKKTAKKKSAKKIAKVKNNN